MKRLAFVFACASPLTLALAQKSPARPTVSMRVSTSGVRLGDSANVVTAVRRGLLADSSIELVERPPIAGQPARKVKYLVTTLLLGRGSALSVNFRVVAVATSTIIAEATASSIEAGFVDSLTTIGRRLARAIAAGRPPRAAP